MLLPPAVTYRETQKRRVLAADLRPGDRVFVEARPDPQRALVYTGREVRDLDLQHFSGKGGFVTNVGPERTTLTVRFGKKQVVVVDLSASTSIVLPSGAKGATTDLTSGTIVDITGFLNRRLGEITTTSTVKIDRAPLGKPAR